MFYNFNYNVLAYTVVILPICEISVWRIPLLCVQWGGGTHNGHRNCPKHVEFYSKKKIEKLVHLVGFIIRIGIKKICPGGFFFNLHDARVFRYLFLKSSAYFNGN